MTTNHIENFNVVCASVARLAAEALCVTKLAAEALAEHRRQIAQLEAIRLEAAALYEKVFPALPCVSGHIDERSKANPQAKPASPFAPSPNDRRTLPARLHNTEWPEAETLPATAVDGYDNSDDKLRVAMRRAAVGYPGNSDFNPAEMFADTSADEFVPKNV